jgi:hypothetical protein
MAASTSAMTPSRGAISASMPGRTLVVGHRQPVLLLGAHGHQRLAAGDQGAQLALGGRRRRPKGWALAGAEVGDQPSVDRVGFGAYLPGGAVTP